MIDPALFARIADLVKKDFGSRCHVNSNQQTITIWQEATTKVHTITVEEKRFKG